MVLPAVADLSGQRMLSIIGCGNLNRRDDGVGVVVAQRLQRWLTEWADLPVQVFDAGTDGMAVMFQARGCDALVLVDACRTGVEAGAIYEVPGSELAEAPASGLNLHEFRWNHALYAGRRLYGEAFPADVTVLLIEAADLGYGLELTPAVASAADSVVARLSDMVGAYAVRRAAE